MNNTRIEYQVEQVHKNNTVSDRGPRESDIRIARAELNDRYRRKEKRGKFRLLEVTTMVDFKVLPD
jgi:hypothetical protein